jgi:hypothetical protein
VRIVLCPWTGPFRASSPQPNTGPANGVGLALIVDEFALLLDLKDVCWAKEGRVSVDVGIGGSSVVGSYFAGLPVIREVARRRRAARAQG